MGLEERSLLSFGDRCLCLDSLFCSIQQDTVFVNRLFGVTFERCFAKVHLKDQISHSISFLYVSNPKFSVSLPPARPSSEVTRGIPWCVARVGGWESAKSEKKKFLSLLSVFSSFFGFLWFLSSHFSPFGKIFFYPVFVSDISSAMLSRGSHSSEEREQKREGGEMYFTQLEIFASERESWKARPGSRFCNTICGILWKILSIIFWISARADRFWLIFFGSSFPTIRWLFSTHWQDHNPSYPTLLDRHLFV